MTSTASEPRVVVYDACVLYPFHLRNVLVELGVHAGVAPRWSDRIHDEWIRNLAGDDEDLRRKLLRVRELMNRVLPAADVRGYERHVETINLPDPDDRHVVAAAIEAGARTILTRNLRDFPAR